MSMKSKNKAINSWISRANTAEEITKNKLTQNTFEWCKLLLSKCQYDT